MTEIKKDILTVEKGILVQSCNCQGPQGGLAGAIARKWPVVRKNYLELLQNSVYRVGLLGSTQLVQVELNLFVANVFGQYDISSKERQTEYCALNYGLHDLVVQLDDVCTSIMPSDVSTKVYFPYKFGCGLGGGNWDLVQTIIEYHFPSAIICNNEK